jgi:hypothetical protein
MLVPLEGCRQCLPEHMTSGSLQHRGLPCIALPIFKGEMPCILTNKKWCVIRINRLPVKSFGRDSGRVNPFLFRNREAQIVNLGAECGFRTIFRHQYFPYYFFIGEVWFSRIY